jgi:DNA ligase 1
MIKQLYGLEKNGDYKQWSVEVFDNKVCPGDEQVTAFILVKHGKDGGAVTEKLEEVTVGKQGRSVLEQAVFQAQAKVKKQLDKGYRESKSELDDLPLLAMLASDYNKVGHRVKFPCYTSVKYDGVRCLASKHAGYVYLKSRTGQEFDIPSISEALNEVMYDGEVLDGEVYIHGVELQDILSAVKRNDSKCDAEIVKAGKKVDKAEFLSQEYEDAKDEFAKALAVKANRERLEFHIFDIPMDGDFEARLAALGKHQETRATHPRVKYCVYNWCASDQSLREHHHKEAVRMGFEGVMIRNMKGVYESGKRSADLQKYKTFLDEEFLILNVIPDKQGDGIFVLDNGNGQVFQCVMGTLEERRHYLENKEMYIGKWLTVKFQTRYKDTLLPQFPVGLGIREGYKVGAEFIPTV